MRWPEKQLTEGVFLERLHRFGAQVRVNGRKEYCHVPNSGRLRELLYPGAGIILVDHGSPGSRNRKTRFSVRLARHRGKWVCIEANIAPLLLKEAWEKNQIPELKAYDQLKAEVPLNAHTRFDFKGTNRATGQTAWVEVKCATLVEKDGTARFPDAPSERASKHLRELMELAQKPKTQALVFFVVQNPHASAVRPKEDTDPLFAETLRQASHKNVYLGAYLAKINLKGAAILRPLKVRLGK
jgi:sugar fermentation stimulation protein A